MAHDPQEKQKVLWLRVHAFATQTFIAIYFSVANAQLVHYFDSTQLPWAYLASGLIGFVIAKRYKALLNRYSRDVLFAGTLIFIGVVAALLTGVGIITHAQEGSLGAQISAFLVFVLASPFFTLVGLESGGLSLSLLDLRQTKRLQARINLGATVASILGCFLMAGLVPNVFTESLYMNFIALLGIVGAVVSLGVIRRKFDLQEPPKVRPEGRRKSSGVFVKQRYTVIMAATGFVSMVVFYLADFLYLSSIPQQTWLQEPGQKSQFIALAFGVMKTGEFILSYLSGGILSRFGLRTGLLLLPAGLLLFMLAAAGVGFYTHLSGHPLSLGHLGEAGHAFSLFFALVLGVKFTERTVRKSIEDPAFRTLYQPLPESKRLKVQGIVDGVFKQWAIIASGLLLLALGYLLPKEGGYVQPQYLAALGLPVLALHLYLGHQLHGLYRNKLSGYLRKGMGWKLAQESLFGFDILRFHARAKHESEYRLTSLRIMEAITPGSVVRELPHMLSGPPAMQQLALRVLPHAFEAGPELIEALDHLIATTEDEALRMRAQAARAECTQRATQSPADIFRLSTPDKERLLRHWHREGHVPQPEVMLRLLKDPDRRVRSGAIRMAGREPHPMYKYPLLELLENPEFASVAAKALSSFGADVLKDLESLFYRKTDHRFRLKVVRIYRRIEHPRATELLFNYLSFPDREVQMEALKSLNYQQFQAKGEHQAQVRQRIEDRVEYLVWLSAKEYTIQEAGGFDHLQAGLHEEGEVNREIILLLLGLLYGHSKLSLVRRALQDRSQVSNRIFALELIDNLLDDEDKKRLMPLFEAKRPVHQIRYFKHRYPQSPRSQEDHLRDIIIHTQANTGLWIKAHAMRLLGPRVQALPQEIAACLYHPHPLIHQTAAAVISRHFPADWPHMLSKLPREQARQLYELVEENQDQEQYIYHKVELMLRIPIFRTLPHFRMLDLAQAFSVRHFRPHEELHFSRMRDREVVCIVIDGALEAYRDDNSYFWFSKHQVFIQDIIPDTPTVKLASRRGCTVLTMDREHFFDLAIHQPSLIEALLEGIHATAQKDFEMENVLSILRNR